MTATDELLPCPFCGGEAHIITAVGESWVLCEKCRATTEMHASKQLAIAAWNRRAKPSQPTHRDELVDYLCDMCANDCDERKVIRVGQGAYDVCERWKESDHD